MTKSDSAAGPPRRAWRVTFDYDGDEIAVRRSELIDKRVPPSDPLLRDGETAGRSGFWLELADADQRTVWRRVMDDPRSTSLEAPAGDRPGELTRATLESPKGTFRVLLPARDDVRYVSVASSPLAPVAEARRARVIARFDVRSGERVGPDEPVKKRARTPGKKSTKRPSSKRSSTRRPRKD